MKRFGAHASPIPISNSGLAPTIKSANNHIIRGRRCPIGSSKAETQEWKDRNV